MSLYNLKKVINSQTITRRILSRAYSDGSKASPYLDYQYNKEKEHSETKTDVDVRNLTHVEKRVLEDKKVLPKKMNVVSFEQVPGPVSLKVLNKIWSFMPKITAQMAGSSIQLLLSIGNQLLWSGDMSLFNRFMTRYGPVVRLRGPFGGDVVVISWLEDVQSIFKQEGQFPIRSCLDCVEKYRLHYRKYKHCGPYLMSGPDWQTFRQSVEHPLQQSMVQQYDKVEDICDEFLDRIKVIRNEQEEVPSNFYKEIHKWGLECMCQVFLNKRFGFLDTAGLSMTSDSGQLLDGFIGATQAVKRCEYGLHFWKFFNTPAWTSLVKHCDNIDVILSKYVHRAQNSLQEKKNNNIKSFDVIESMLLKHGMMIDDVMTILLDIMLIGVNATSHAVAFLLYHLSKYQRCQSKLYQEISHQPLKLSKDGLSNLPYLQACIKESLRLKPPMPVLSRVLTEDTNIHNYNIPKGTYVVIASCLTGWREEYFEEASKFNPNRWLENNEAIPKLASIPFGHGPKQCLAKELAEMQIGLLITKILRKYRVEYLYGDLQSTGRLLGQPKKSLNFRFIERFPLEEERSLE